MHERARAISPAGRLRGRRPKQKIGQAMSDPKDRKPSRPRPRRLLTTASARAARVSTSAATRYGSGSWRRASTAATSARRSSRSSTSATCRSPRRRAISVRRGSIRRTSRRTKPKPPGGGFNPYDSAGSEKVGGNPYDNARNTARSTQPPSPGAPSARKPMDLKRLEEWRRSRSGWSRKRRTTTRSRSSVRSRPGRHGTECFAGPMRRENFHLA